MWIYAIAIALAGVLTLAPQPVSALSQEMASGETSTDVPAVDSVSQNTTIVSVALAENIQDREPVGSVNPSISCDKNDQSQATALPVIDSNSNGRMFFWNSVESSADTTLSHVWLMKRDQEWKPMAKVDLPIAKSHAYRTWSSKKFDRNWHLGEWKIEVARADQPDVVLCQSSFRVE